jgi:hypothetical protein
MVATAKVITVLTVMIQNWRAICALCADEISCLVWICTNPDVAGWFDWVKRPAQRGAFVLPRSWKFRGRRKARKRGRERGVGIRRTTRRVIKSCQIESYAQLKTAGLLQLRDADCSKECILGRRRIGRIALEQNLAAQAMQD